MATYIHNRDIKITEKIQSPYIYQGEDICNKSFFLFQLINEQNPRLNQNGANVPVFICIKTTGLLLKIIDLWCMCLLFK